MAVLLTAANYLVLTGYDALALRYIHHALPYRHIALASFIGYAFSNNLSLLAGGAARLRLYPAWGVSAGEVSKVVAFCTLTFCLGLFASGGVVLLVKPLALPAALHLPFRSSRPLGLLFLGLIGGYLSWSTLGHRPLRVRAWELLPPVPWLSLAQVAVSSIDWILVAGVFSVLLPPAAPSSLEVFGIFLLAQVAGVLSQVPGGLGVFETVVVLLLSPTLPAAVVLGSLLAYRAIYYLLPLGVAAVLLGASEVVRQRAHGKQITSRVGHWAAALTPHLLAVTTFLSGALLLFSGATPAVHSRLAWLHEFVPLPLIEVSHFLGGLAGVGLLLVARGLQQRLAAAYHRTFVLLGAGIVVSLLKGLAYEEALILAVMLAALLPCRSQFYRKAELLSQRFSPGWAAAVLLVVGGSIGLGMWSYRHVAYAHELWWRFALTADAARSLRATGGVLAGTVLFALTRVLRPAQPEPELPGPAALERARAIVTQSRTTSVNLALLGDKALLLNEKGNAFLMYGTEGRSWVALGGPVGPPEERTELIWQFRELCDRRGGWTIFYEVGPANLPLYLDLGLSLVKLGEEARVPLGAFSLEGGAHKELRRVCRRLENAGYTFAVIPTAEVPSLLPQLQQVSDAWLEEKHTREKGFSRGSFTPAYVQHFPAAVVCQTGKIVAFATLWLGADKEELSPDLMRYLPEAPLNVMEYLSLQLMLWGKREGYRWFNLGMAPLAGPDDRALAPLWSRLGAVVFRHGEHFYNFQGLRQYKENFHPEWEPRYLASPGSLALPRILIDLAALISGGLKGVMPK
jgi:phosphatidylglycerol lysyltransferase